MCRHWCAGAGRVGSSTRWGGLSLPWDPEEIEGGVSRVGSEGPWGQKGKRDKGVMETAPEGQKATNG